MGRHKRRKNSPIDEQDVGLQHHIQGLGLASVPAYRQWCAAHGFSRRLNKTRNERYRERYILTSGIADNSLKSRRREAKNPVETMVAICHRKLDISELVQPQLRLLAHCVKSMPVPSHQDALARGALAKLIESASAARTGFFHQAAVIEQFGGRPGNTYLEALVAIAANYPRWRRRLSDWKPRSKNTRRQFESLVRHLFCTYKMPTFLDSVWFLGHDRPARNRQGWYLHVGGGGSIRDCDLPVKYTRRMGHYFMQTPSLLSIDQALRWGQLRTLGFTDRQAHALLETRVGENFEREAFWVTVFRWLANFPEIKETEYGPLIDYLYNQRFVDQRQIFGNEEQHLGPPQPNLTMRGRQPTTLLAHMHKWHQQLARDNTQFEARWEASGFAEFSFIEGAGKNRRVWTIRELLSREALVVEGRQLNHCVATYVHYCATGRTSIWTMEAETTEGRRKHLTIEVRNRTGRIVEARGKANRLPKQQELSILRRWAAESGLTVGVGIG